MNQLGVVIGIFVAQSAGVALAVKSTRKNGKSNSSWRWVPAISSFVSVGQLLWGLLVAVDGPLSIENSGVSNARTKAQQVRQRLWTVVPDAPSSADTPAESTPGSGATASSTAYVENSPDLRDNPEQEALLGSNNDDAASQTEEDDLPNPITTKDLFTHPRIRPGMLMIVITQVGQQLGGVNAVLYYSTGIMGGLFQGGEGADQVARKISVGITVVNALMT